MTLTTALRSATSALSSHSQQISTISRNISGVGDPTYVRRNSDVYTSFFGSTRVETQRLVNQSVHGSSLVANAEAAGANALALGIDRVASLQQLESFAFSPSSLLASLQQSVEFAAAAPSDQATLSSLVEQARTVSSALNSSYDEVLSMRTQADKEISNSVASINALLTQIEEVNNEIVGGAQQGKDLFDSMDVRDQLINQLSEEIGINLIPAANNDIIITTDSGALLFEGKPRDVVFEPTSSFGPTTSGNQLRIDGVVVSGPDAVLELKSGKIAGNLSLRDDFLVQQKNQLDEVARGLVDLFAEEDQTGGGKPKLVGLFTWSGGPNVPAAGTLEVGIASSIRINPVVNPEVGGNPEFIRDGALNSDPDYLYNIDGGVGYSDRLFALAAKFEEVASFDPSAGLPANQSLTGFAASSLDQLNSKRASALDSRDFRNEVANQFLQTLQSETGVNLDYELSRMLEVERTYQANARILNAVDDMLITLLDVAR